MDNEKRQKIIDTVKKLLNLAGNNPSENEATAAALKAQLLMAEYNIEDVEIGDEVKDEPIENIICDAGTGKKWKYKLGSLVARNFRCKCWYKGRWGIVFYGHRTDAKIAEQVFWYLFKAGDKFANRHVREKKKENEQCYFYNSTRGCYNSYIAGFLEGIEQKLAKQSKALMVIVPPDVEKEYEVYSVDFGKINTVLSVPKLDKKAFDEGVLQGKSTMDARGLETAEAM